MQIKGREENQLEGKETRNAIVLSLAFLSTFTAYTAIQDLQSSLNEAKNLGLISLSVLYGCIIFSGIMAPTIIRYLGVKRSMIISWIVHSVYIACNFHPAFYTLIPASILLGAISGFLWTSQSIYITVCSFSLAKLTDQDSYAVLSKLNGMFFTIFAMTQIPGNIISATVLQTGTYSNVTDETNCGPDYCPFHNKTGDIDQPDHKVVYIFMGVFLVCDIIALVITYFFLAPLPQSQWSSDVSLKGSLTSFFTTLVKTKLIFLVPFIMYQAMEQATLWGDFTRRTALALGRGYTMGRKVTEDNQLEGKETRNGVVLSIVFLSAFTAYIAIQDLQSSLNEAKNLGLISLSVLYGCIIFSGIMAPTIIRYLGVKRAITISWIVHSVYTACNFYPAFYTLIPASILLGAISGFLWTSQGIYITTCAFSLAKLTEQDSYVVLSKLNGMFFTIFEMTQIPGNIISATVLQTGTYSNVTDETNCGPDYCPFHNKTGDIDQPDKKLVYTFMGVFLACDIIALVITYFFLAPLPQSQWSSDVSLKGSLTSFFTTLGKTKLIFLVPFIMYQAMEQATLWGDFTRSYISCPIGIQMVGFVMATYGATTSLSAFVFSRIAKYTGRYILFLTAASLQAGVFFALFFWKPTHEQTPYIFVVAIVWACAEGIWQTQSSSLIAMLFPDKKEPAFANYHTWKSVTFTITFALSNVLCLRTKLIVVLSLLGIAMTLYTGVELYMKTKKGSDYSEKKDETK